MKDKKQTNNQKIPFDDNCRKIVLGTAFLDYCRFANISNHDIDVLYARIEKLKHDYDKEHKEYALNLLIKYDLEGINSKEALKQRIEEQKAQIAEKIFGKSSLQGEDNVADLIKSYLKQLGFSTDADLMTDAILQHKLEEKYDTKQRKADRLGRLLNSARKKMIDKLYTNFEAYRKSGKKHDLVENMLENIHDNLSERNTKKFPFKVLDKVKDISFRKMIRKFFNKRKDPRYKNDKGGVKAAFLTVYGTLMKSGRDMMYGGDYKQGYKECLRAMEDWFGPDYKKEMLKAFNAKDEKELEEKFYAKAESLYKKTAIALLSKKREFDQEERGKARSGQQIDPETYTTDYGKYLDNAINRTFINGLCEGKNLVSSLGLIELCNDNDKRKMHELQEQEKLHGDLNDKQHVSVHHKVVTIGALLDVLPQLCPGIKPEEMVEIGSDIANQFGNLELVIGKDVHKSLEPDGEIELTENPNNNIFDAKINQNSLEYILTQPGLPKFLREEMQKYVDKQVITVSESLNFSESPIVANARPRKEDRFIAMDAVERVRSYDK